MNKDMSCDVLGEFLSLCGPLLHGPATFGAGCLCPSLLWCSDLWDWRLQKFPPAIAHVKLSGAQQMMPSTSGIWDRNMLGGEGCCSYIFTFVSSLMSEGILPLPDHVYPSACVGQTAALHFKERKQIFWFVSLTCLNFLHVPTLYLSCFCKSNMPLFLNPVSPSWCPGPRAWSIYLWPPRAEQPVTAGFHSPAPQVRTTSLRLVVQALLAQSAAWFVMVSQ